jgi:S-DNA-T family DNA segregation ATPase FtsK/SpoIIIE
VEKSFFFKQLLVSLLKCSDHIQLYLIDLKRGVEMRPFASLNNVKVVKENSDAVLLLESIVKEMDRRFKFLEDNKVQEIDPKRDKLDRIFVGIDEASELFIVSKTSKEAKDNANRARELTDKIAKLGRAAGIHLILATQKVVKETIDTNVQTNINARVVFRVNTIASSMTVLGNKKAAELPQVKGRAIWSVGSQDVVVQVPKLALDEMNEELGALTNKFNGEVSPVFGPMLSQLEKQHKPRKGFVKQVDESESNESLQVDHVD